MFHINFNIFYDKYTITPIISKSKIDSYSTVVKLATQDMTMVALTHSSLIALVDSLVSLKRGCLEQQVHLMVLKTATNQAWILARLALKPIVELEVVASVAAAVGTEVATAGIGVAAGTVLAAFAQVVAGTLPIEEGTLAVEEGTQATVVEDTCATGTQVEVADTLAAVVGMAADTAVEDKAAQGLVGILLKGLGMEECMQQVHIVEGVVLQLLVLTNSLLCLNY